MIKELILNAALMFACLTLTGQWFRGRRFPRTAGIRTKAAFGLFMGITGVLLMLLGIQAEGRIVIDLRHLAIVAAAWLGGGVPALIAAAVSGISRIVFFSWNEAAVISGIGVFLMGIWCALVVRLMPRGLLQYVLLNIVSFAMIACAFYINVDDSQSLIELQLNMLLLSAAGAVLVYLVSDYVARVNDADLRLQDKSRKLRTSEELYRNLILLSPDAVYAVNNGQLLFINKRGAELLGASAPEELSGINPMQLIHPDDQARAAAEIAVLEVDHHQTITSERRYRRLDGTYIETETSSKWMEYDDRPAIMVIVRDIGERKGQEKRLMAMVEENSVLAAVVAATTNAVMLTNPNLPDNPIVYVNPSFEQITGYSFEEVLGKNPRLLQSGVHGKDFYSKLWASVRTNGHWQGEIINKKKNGEPLIEWLNIIAIKDQQGAVKHYAAVFSDITKRKQMEQQLKDTNLHLHQLTSLDGLTGIFNRRYFDEQIEEVWYRQLIANQPMTLVLLDIDHFKLYNDSYGHLEGDACLKAVAAVLQEQAASMDAVAVRYGGEEFAVLFTNTAKDGEQASEQIRRAVRSLRRLHAASPTDAYVTVSVGVTTMLPWTGGRPEELIAFADRALYEAKAAGRNRTVKYP